MLSLTNKNIARRKQYAEMMADPNLAAELKAKESERKKKFRLANLERLRLKAKVKYHANRDQRVKYFNAWQKNNKDKVRQYTRRCYLKNLQRRRAGVKAWADANRERISQYHKKYYRANKQQYHLYAFKRQSLKKAVTSNLNKISEFIVRVKACKTVICYYCERRIKPRGCHIDHIIPLSKGGPHCVENLCISCQKCNLTKGSKFLTEWIKNGQQILPI